MRAICQTEYLTADGSKLVADIGGPEDASLVVLLHGGGQTRHSWSGAMSLLIDSGFRVINFDARGHGQSDWFHDGDYTLLNYAHDLQAILSRHDGPVALVGASMGGMTALYAVGSGMAPQAQALVMVDIVMRPAPAGETRVRTFMERGAGGFATLEEAADAVATYNPHRQRSKHPNGLLKNLRRGDDGRLYWHWDPRLLDMKPNADTPDWADQLRQVSGGVTIPTMLIRGGKSDIVDDAGVAEMQHFIPQLEVLSIAGAGHMVAGDKNDPFSRSAVSFLRRIMPV